MRIYNYWFRGGLGFVLFRVEWGLSNIVAQNNFDCIILLIGAL